MPLADDLATAGAEDTVVAVTRTATTTLHRPTLIRHLIRSRTRARHPAPRPGGRDCSAAPPQAQLPVTPWGAATTTATAGPAQDKPAHRTGSETATAEQVLRARPLGEVEGRRLLHHRLAAGRGTSPRALAGVVGGRCEKGFEKGKGNGKGN